jgi:hypothetical protein
MTLFPLMAFSEGRSSGGGGLGGPRGRFGLGALALPDDAVSYDGGGSLGIADDAPSAVFSDMLILVGLDIYWNAHLRLD